MSEIITPDMIAHFKYRTGYHLWCVHKWTNKIAGLNDPRINFYELLKERDVHDQMKWLEPEYTPYLLISWSYKCKREGVEFNLPDDIKQKLHEATFHHIKNHKHHPEFWDDNATIQSLNKDDRDRPSAGKIVDGTKMPLTYVATMVADWFAMSEELGGHPAKWAADNINVRWKFDNEQIKLINYLIETVWGTHDPL
jgi:hypothetical protein